MGARGHGLSRVPMVAAFGMLYGGKGVAGGFEGPVRSQRSAGDALFKFCYGVIVKRDSAMEYVSIALRI